MRLIEPAEELAVDASVSAAALGPEGSAGSLEVLDGAARMVGEPKTENLSQIDAAAHGLRRLVLALARRRRLGGEGVE